MDQLKEQIEKQNQAQTESHFEAFIAWAKDTRNMTEGELVEVLFKGMAAIGNQELAGDDHKAAFGATVQGPNFPMRIEVARMTEEELAELVAQAKTGDETEH
jgi:hypothetical protein